MTRSCLWYEMLLNVNLISDCILYTIKFWNWIQIVNIWNIHNSTRKPPIRKLQLEIIDVHTLAYDKLQLCKFFAQPSVSPIVWIDILHIRFSFLYKYLYVIETFSYKNYILTLKSFSFQLYNQKITKLIKLNFHPLFCMLIQCMSFPNKKCPVTIYLKHFYWIQF